MSSIHSSVVAALAPLFRQDGYVAGNTELDEAILTVHALAALQPWNKEIVELERFVLHRTVASHAAIARTRFLRRMAVRSRSRGASERARQVPRPATHARRAAPAARPRWPNTAHRARRTVAYQAQ